MSHFSQETLTEKLRDGHVCRGLLSLARRSKGTVKNPPRAGIFAVYQDENTGPYITKEQVPVQRLIETRVVARATTDLGLLVCSKVVGKGEDAQAASLPSRDEIFQHTKYHETYPGLTGGFITVGPRSLWLSLISFQGMDTLALDLKSLPPTPTLPQIAHLGILVTQLECGSNSAIAIPQAVNAAPYAELGRLYP